MLNSFVHFFESKCHSSLSDARFGICDDLQDKKAYLSTDPIANRWCLVVENINHKKVDFHAIDHCINLPDDHGKRCEGLIRLHEEDRLIFLELKDPYSKKISGLAWSQRRQDAAEQLSNTIRLFRYYYGEPTRPIDAHIGYPEEFGSPRRPFSEQIDLFEQENPASILSIHHTLVV